ncbi:hypothetical protein HY605_02395 [Candidatus Peregrinibacteria bacterium]|nr:hypothetical protein [Candidatus Peregrinibacteria bacterium]
MVHTQILECYFRITPAYSQVLDKARNNIVKSISMDTLDPTIRERLTQLHGDSTEELRHNSILLVEPDEQVRKVITRILTGIFPGYEIVGVSPEQALEKMRGELKSKLAMVLIDTEERIDLIGTIELLRDDSVEDSPSNAGDIPLVLMSAGIVDDSRSGGSFNDTIRMWGNEGKIDGLVDKPFSREGLAGALSQAINYKALGVPKSELDARTAVLQEFLASYLDRLPLWLNDLRGLKIMSQPDCQDKEDLTMVSEAVEGMNKMMAAMAATNLSQVTRQVLRKFLHDFASPLLVMAMIFPDLVKEGGALQGSDLQTLKILQSELNDLNKVFEQIRSARGEKGGWGKVNLNVNTGSGVQEQILELPDGVKACVVDNEELVLNVVSRDLSKAGAAVLTASSLAEIAAIQDEDVNLVLLDNDLGEGLKGHSLVMAIRARWPQALIVAHTGDAEEITADPDNEYKKFGIEVIPKRAWRALSGVVRRKLPKTA